MKANHNGCHEVKQLLTVVANNRQKQILSSQVERIRWTNKLSPETINLAGKIVKEIQVFEITLRSEASIHTLLDVIDKAIPYPIIFQIHFGDKYQLRTSAKHLNPLNENTAVIDWTFSSSWTATKFSLSLERSLDHIFFDFCMRISGARTNLAQLSELIDFERQRSILGKKIKRLQTELNKAAQFNRKVALNLALIEAKGALAQLVGNSLIDKAK
jgi:Domain of unknown function (DUF4391)